MELMAKQRREREARKKAAELAAKKRKVTGGIGGPKSRYSSGTGGLSQEEKDKRATALKSARSIDQKRNQRRGTGVKNRTDQPKSTTQKSSKLKVTIHGKAPTAIQRKLLDGGWSAKELENKITASKKAKTTKTETKTKTTPKKKLNSAYYKPDGTPRRKYIPQKYRK